MQRTERPTSYFRQHAQQKILQSWLSELDAAGKLHGDEVFGDGMFAAGKRGGERIEKTKIGKGSKRMVVVDGEGVPIGMCVESAAEAEVNLIEQMLDTVKVPKMGVGRPKTKVKHPIYDKVADSDALRIRLKQRGTALISPLIPCFTPRKNFPISTP